jgi:hypothetical protein
VRKLRFKEVLDEGILKRKSAVINRAPVMTAWATVVAERLGFGRGEALSIGKRAPDEPPFLTRILRAASVYTETNAAPTGAHSPSKGKETQKPTDGAQPYVDLMGRR